MLVLMWIVSFALRVTSGQEKGTSMENCTILENEVKANYFPKQTSYPVSSIVYFLCKSGSVLIGNNSLTCQKGGRWNKEFPFCCELSQNFESVIQSSVHENNSANLAVDSLINTTSVTNYEQNPSWMAKFSQISKILAIKLKSPGNANINVTVRSHLNISTTCGIIPVTGIPETDKEEIVHCPANTSGNDVILQVNEKSISQLKLTEVQVCAVQMSSGDKVNNSVLLSNSLLSNGSRVPSNTSILTDGSSVLSIDSVAQGNGAPPQLESDSQALFTLYIPTATVAGSLIIVAVCFAAVKIRMRKRRKKVISGKTEYSTADEFVRNPTDQFSPNESEYTQILYDQIPEQGDSPRPRLPSSPRPKQIESPLLEEISSVVPCLQHEYCQPSDKSDISCQLYCKCNLRENDPHHVYIEPNDLVIQSEHL